MKSAMIRARIEPELKNQAERLFEQLGLTMTDAIGLFFRRALSRQGLPFDVRLPNRTTIKTFKATDAGKNLIHAKDAKEMFKKLGI